MQSAGRRLPPNLQTRWQTNRGLCFRESRAKVVRPMWNSRETRGMPHARNTLRKHMRLRVLRTSTADFPAVEDAANAQSLDLEKQYLHRQKSAWRRLASRRTIFSRTRKDVRRQPVCGCARCKRAKEYRCRYRSANE